MKFHCHQRATITEAATTTEEAVTTTEAATTTEEEVTTTEEATTTEEEVTTTEEAITAAADHATTTATEGVALQLKQKHLRPQLLKLSHRTRELHAAYLYIILFATSFI